MFFIVISNSIKGNFFRRILTVYTSVVIFIAAFVGFVFMLLSLNEMRTYTTESRIEKIQMAVDDLQYQYETMQDIALRIKMSYYFKDTYLRQGNYYESVAIKSLNSYMTYAPYDADIYLFNRVYSCAYSGSAKYIYPLFLQYILKIDDERFISEYLYNAVSNDVVELENKVIFIFPVNINNSYQPGGDNIVLFVINKDSLADRLKSMTGFDSESFRLRWNGISLLGSNEISGEIDAVCNGNFMVSLERQSDPVQILLNSFRRRLFNFMLLALTISILAAVITSIRMYEPIRNLMLKFGKGDERKEKYDELNELEMAFNYALEDAKNSRQEVTEYVKEIERKTDLLKRQMLRLLVCGGYETVISSKLKMVGLDFKYPVFCVISCSVVHPEALKEIENGNFEHADCYITYTNNPQNPLIIVNMLSESDIADVCDVLYRIPEVEHISWGESVYNIDAISRSYLSSKTSGSDRDSDVVYQSENVYDDSQLTIAMTCIGKGEKEEAINRIRLLFDEIESDLMQDVKRPYAYMDIIFRLKEYASKHSISIPYEMYGVAFISTNNSDIKACVLKLIDYISDRIIAIDQSTDIQSRIVRYINEHFNDQQLDANSIMSNFHISNKQLSQFVRNATGLGYREYVIKVRMNRAKQLLEETDCSINDVSTQVGYSYVPYFIKTFKGLTGLTPGQFREQTQRD